jgi:S1-C subfamily serine protease
VEAPLAGGAAEEAGIKSGDIILMINDVPVNSVSMLQENVGLHRPGDKLKLTIDRAGARKEVFVTLKNKTGNTELVDKPTEVNQQLGARFEEMSETDLTRLGLRNGIRVSEVTSGKLRAAGVKPGYVITEVNGKSVKSMTDLTNVLNNSKGYFYIGGMYPSGEKVYYSFN